MAAVRQPLKRLPALLAPAAALVRGTGIASWALSRTMLQRSKTAFAAQLLMLVAGLVLLNVGKGRQVLGVGLDKLGLYATVASVLFAGLKVWGDLHRVLAGSDKRRRRSRRSRRFGRWRLRQLTVVALTLLLTVVPALLFILAPKLPVLRDWPSHGLERLVAWLQHHPGWWYVIATAVVCTLLGTGWPAALRPRSLRGFGWDLLAPVRRLLRRLPRARRQQPEPAVAPPASQARPARRRLGSRLRGLRPRLRRRRAGDEPARP